MKKKQKSKSKSKIKKKTKKKKLPVKDNFEETGGWDTSVVGPVG